MGKYQPYQEYQDSGALNLGAIPCHWSAKPLKTLSSYNDEVLPEGTDPDFTIEYVDISSVSATDGIRETTSMNFGVAPSRARRIVRDGDVLVSTVRTYLEAIAWVSEPPKNLIASTGFAVIRANPALLYRRFAGYALRARYFIDEVVSRSVGVSYPAINASDLVSIKIAAPPLDEQQSIAAFLDHETAKIDRLIAKQERLIELLKEKRQAVISHAVTKGLNPDAPMKDSGVEWLGEVPAHWNVKQLRYLVRFFGGGTPSKDKEEYWSGDIPWVSPKDMKSDFISNAQDKITEAAVIESSTKKIPVGAVLIVVRGMILLHSVPVGLTEVEVTVNQDMKAMVAGKHVDGKYILYLLKGIKSRILELMDSSAHGTRVLPTEDMARITLPVPPLKEQAAICDHIEERLGKFGLLIQKGEQQIDLLREHRASLISSAVTGKIDVRGWQKPNTEPEETAAAASA
ncbi:MAG: restriction endonuclease subunit S [Proteobacteria bacterium]|nr:MAG: restriction endonuclease subunit S [Pseudomonadota bacterium]QKK10359.1 MAG: restriction endonuclease subunit S [Pseudomonadota bacterium]